MSMSVGRPVSPTTLPPSQSQVKVAQPVVSKPSVQTASKPLNTQESFGAARQSVVGKTSETVNPSQGGQHLKQGIDQADSEQLMEGCQTLMESPMVKEEFGSTAPSSVKAVYALGSDTAVLGSADSLVNKVNSDGVKEHSAITQSGLSSLSENDKLTIVGHGDEHTFGGKTPAELAAHLKASGVTVLDKISLKGCNSDQYAQKLFTALEAEGIQVRSITGRTEKVAVAHSGRTLVEHGDQMLHQVEGSKIEVTKGGVTGVYEGHFVESVQSKSTEIASMGHSGILVLDKIDYEQIKLTLKNGTPSYDVSEDSIRRIASNMEKNGGKYVANTLSGKGPPQSHAIADEITANYMHKLSLRSSTTTTTTTRALEESSTGSKAEPNDSELFKKLFLQVQRPGTFSTTTTTTVEDDDNDEFFAKQRLTNTEIEEMNRSGVKCISVNVIQVIPDRIITCHEFAYDKKGMKAPDCNEVIARADLTGKPYAVCFSGGRVAHSAYQDGGVWHQALRFGEHDGPNADSVIFTTPTIQIGDYEPILIYNPSESGSKDKFVKAFGEQNEFLQDTIEKGQKERQDLTEKTDLEQVKDFVKGIKDNCETDFSTAMKLAKMVCKGIDSDATSCTQLTDKILNQLESQTPKTKGLDEIINYIRKNREF